MSTGCAIVASNTQPVREVLTDRESALLVDFFDVDALVSSVSDLLRDPSLRRSLSDNAVSRASHYSTEAGIASWDAVLAS